MQLFLLLLSLVFIFTTQSHAASAQTTVTAYCPKVSELSRSVSSSGWAKYQYTGESQINLPEVNNTLHFTGNSNAPSATYFYGATWTDRTFLCLYNYLDDAIVTYESQLDPHVKRCYFSQPGNSECISPNINDCPIICEPDDESALSINKSSK